MVEMSSYPEDIKVNILSWLPVKSILRFRCISKAWCILLRSSYFIKLQLKNHVNEKNNNNHYSFMLTEHYSELIYSIDFDASLMLLSDDVVEINDYQFKYPDYEAQIFGSCDGLFCICIRYKYDGIANKAICLWNPSTKEYKLLPDPLSDDVPSYLCHMHDTIIHGLFYDYNMNDYKLVRVIGNHHDFTSEAQVYTLGSNSWKRIQNYIPCRLTNSELNGVLVNEALHWLGYTSSSKVIVSFDISEEIFKDLPEPEEDSYNNKDIMNVGILGGKICVMCNNASHTGIDMWVMQNYGVRKSWVKHLTIVQREVTKAISIKLIQSFKNDKILLMKDGQELILYDTKYEQVSVIDIHGDPEPRDVCSYVKSLVSLNSNTYVGGEEEKEAREYLDDHYGCDICSEIDPNM